MSQLRYCKPSVIAKVKISISNAKTRQTISISCSQCRWREDYRELCLWLSHVYREIGVCLWERWGKGQGGNRRKVTERWIERCQGEWEGRDGQRGRRKRSRDRQESLRGGRERVLHVYEVCRDGRHNVEINCLKPKDVDCRSILPHIYLSVYIHTHTHRLHKHTHCLRLFWPTILSQLCLESGQRASAVAIAGLFQGGRYGVTCPEWERILYSSFYFYVDFLLKLAPKPTSRKRVQLKPEESGCYCVFYTLLEGGINVQLKPIGHFKWSQQCILSWRNPLHLLSNEFGKQYNRSPQTIITEIYCESFVELLWIIWLSRLGASREGSELKIPHYSTRIVLNICYHHLAGTFK